MKTCDTYTFMCLGCYSLLLHFKHVYMSLHMHNTCALVCSRLHAFSIGRTTAWFECSLPNRHRPSRNGQRREKEEEEEEEGGFYKCRHPAATLMSLDELGLLGCAGEVSCQNVPLPTP